MKVLITGGAGYIGSHTIIEIIENTDWEVISIDNYANSSSDTYDRIEKITGKKIKFYDVDLKDLQSTEQVFVENPDIKGVIHFAAFKAVGESVKRPLYYYDNNINSLKNILLCQDKFNISNLIFSSSCAVYGNITELPVTENTKPGKLESPYANTKVVGENMISDFLNQKKKINAISLRFFNPVGAHSTGLIGELPIGVPNNLVPYMTKVAKGLQEELTVYGGDYDTVDGTCVRDYIHVCDIAEAHVLALKFLFNCERVFSHDIINLGSGIGSSVMEIINAFEKVNDLKLKYIVGAKRQGDIPVMFANSHKAEKLLSWKPKRTLKEMMKSAWEWEKNLAKELK